MKTRTAFVSALLVAFVVVFAVHAIDFRGSVRDFEKASGGGVLLDVKPSFAEDEIYRRLDAYGPAGRSNYAFRNVTVDVLLPFAVLPALFLLMLHATREVSANRKTRGLLLSLPFVYVAFDLAENGTVLALLAHFPERLHIGAAILPYLTVVKRAASLLAIAVPLMIFGARYVRRAIHR